jgi:LysM repeat protein
LSIALNPSSALATNPHTTDQVTSSTQPAVQQAHQDAPRPTSIVLTSARDLVLQPAPAWPTATDAQPASSQPTDATAPSPAPVGPSSPPVTTSPAASTSPLPEVPLWPVGPSTPSVHDGGPATRATRQEPGPTTHPPNPTAAQPIPSPSVSTPPTSAQPTPAPPVPGSPVVRVPGQAAIPKPTATVTVEPGDSLWAITAQRLGPHASDAEIAVQWPSWYRANHRVIGNDPALLRPGQRLVVPSSQKDSP